MKWKKDHKIPNSKSKLSDATISGALDKDNLDIDDIDNFQNSDNEEDYEGFDGEANSISDDDIQSAESKSKKSKSNGFGHAKSRHVLPWNIAIRSHSKHGINHEPC